MHPQNQTPAVGATGAQKNNSQCYFNKEDSARQEKTVKASWSSREIRALMADPRTGTKYPRRWPFNQQPIDLSSKEARALHAARIAYKKDSCWQNFMALRHAYVQLTGEA